MDIRRASHPVIDPKVKRVGFFDQPQPEPPHFPDSPPHDPVSSVILPPPRLLSERTAAVPVPESRFRRHELDDQVPIGSYNPTRCVLKTSPTASITSSSAGIIDGEFSEDCSGAGWFRGSELSFPDGGLDIPAVKPCEVLAENRSNVAVNVNNLRRDTEKKPEAVKEVCPDTPSVSQPLKAKTTKAERRALQEAQRAAKASKANGSSAVAESGKASPAKSKKQSSQKKDGPPVTSSVTIDKKSINHPLEKERKKDPPPQRMQFDDQNRVEKAKRRALVNQTEARNRVELFRHLPQYEHGNQLPNLESRLFQLDSMHPAVFKVGLRYMAGDISGVNARCTEMLRALQDAIIDYSTPPEKVLIRDLTAKINSYVSFISECRPLSISMGNAIRFVKSHIAKLPLSYTDAEAKASLCSDIDRFINEKIIIADKVIVGHATTKIRDGDVLLTYGLSCVVEMILLSAHELGKKFRVVVVDSRPKFESQALLARLMAKGLSCTYTHINAISYIMHEVTKVFLGASAVLSNGTVLSRIGTACIAMVAHEFRVPVLICCEAFKFHERVLLDSICCNEIGDPGAVATVPGRMDINYLDNWTNKENLQLLNLMYDVTPSDYISVIVTDHGMIPPTSVPVIVREYGQEHYIT
ncbi:translation initiation factor eIF-2B subunit delta [Trifolium repens]|nr:translation initiation factor eIF-2B subunit delta [Trifolium repens]